MNYKNAFIGGALGGSLGFFLGSRSGGDSAQAVPDSNEALIATANASRDVQVTQSNNNLLAMQTQAAVMTLGILENARNARFQTMAWLTERLDASDIKLQIATENARLHMKEEGNRHVEAMEEIELDARELRALLTP
jgi:hypothetical protein